MNKALKLIFLLLVAIPFSSIIYAQENPYTDIPMSRTDDGGFVLGDPTAEVKLIEFSDFICPHCQEYKPNVDIFIEEYVKTGQAQFEYRMVPIVDPNISPFAAGLVECADIQSEGLFWYAHDVMFDLVTNARFSAETITEFSETLGLDEASLQECAFTATQYEADTDLARSLGVNGTPAVAVQYSDSEPVFLALPAPEHFEQIINAQRPDTNEPVTIDTGRYTGIQTYRTDDGGFVLGDPDAPLTLVAFEDFMCPHCQNYQPTIHTFVKDYVATGKAKFEYRFYPLVDPEFSFLTSQVAECIGLQDPAKFWDAHDLLFEFANSSEIDSEIASVIAMLVSVDADQVNSCVESASIQPLIDIALGQNSQVTGTPGVRARGEDGQLNIIYAGQEPLQRGAIPIEALSALFDGSEEYSIGQPEVSLLNDDFLNDDSLVTGDPCTSPCWQNIIPGETTLDEARTIIGELATANIVQDSANGFAFTVDTNAICCQISSQDGTTVSAIFLQHAPINTLGAVIETHGDPTFVTGESFSDNESILTMFYPNLNALVYAMVAGTDGQLSESSPVFTVIYTSDELMATIIDTNLLDNWKGFLTYSEYMDGEYDNAP